MAVSTIFSPTSSVGGCSAAAKVTVGAAAGLALDQAGLLIDAEQLTIDEDPHRCHGPGHEFLAVAIEHVAAGRLDRDHSELLGGSDIQRFLDIGHLEEPHAEQQDREQPSDEDPDGEQAPSGSHSSNGVVRRRAAPSTHVANGKISAASSML